MTCFFDFTWLLFICFLYCAKEGIVAEISKVSWPLEKSLPLCKGDRKCKIKFSVSPYCTRLFSRKENFKFLEVALSAVLCNGAVGWIYEDINTTLDIYWLLKNGHKNTQTSCKVCSNLTKCTTQLTFVLLVSFLLTLNTFLTLLFSVTIHTLKR